jgi:hypothetical protein
MQLQKVMNKKTLKKKKNFYLIAILKVTVENVTDPDSYQNVTLEKSYCSQDTGFFFKRVRIRMQISSGNLKGNFFRVFFNIKKLLTAFDVILSTFLSG